MEQRSSAQFKQMLAFYVSGAVTIGAALIARRSTNARKFVPKLFEANHRPPEFNMVKDALHAVGQATVLSISSFAFLVSGTLWVMNIQDTKHFSQTMIKMLGGEKRREELLNMPVAPEVKEIENDLNSLFKN